MKSAAGLWIDHRKAIVVETADKMTDHQITDKVPRHYAEKNIGQGQ